MPGYLSHAIMGNELHKKCLKDEKLFKNEVDLNGIKTYSLGIDLSHFTKGSDIHSIKTQEFLLNLIKYIKENNLIENKDALAFLYGHIAHYYFDTNVHPFIYYIEKGCIKTGPLGTHSMVEGYLDAFMIENILKEKYKNIKPSFFNRGNLNNPNIKRLIFETYNSTYKRKDALNSYKNVLRILTLIETCTKSKILTEELLIKLFSFDRFLEINNLTREEIINKNKSQWRIPLTGETHNESFIELYNKVVEMTMYAIVKVNQFLYDGRSITTLYDLFPNISYDTGVDINLGYEFTYNRKNNLKN